MRPCHCSSKSRNELVRHVCHRHVRRSTREQWLPGLPIRLLLPSRLSSAYPSNMLSWHVHQQRDKGLYSGRLQALPDGLCLRWWSVTAHTMPAGNHSANQQECAMCQVRSRQLPRRRRSNRVPSVSKGLLLHPRLGHRCPLSWRDVFKSDRTVKT